MPEVEPRVWWAEVQHLREPLERRSSTRRAERRAGGSHAAERRTVKIRGQVVAGAPRRELRDAVDGAPSQPYDVEAAALPALERGAEIARATAPAPRPRRSGPRRPAPRVRERIGARPDRIAGWAVLFVLFMALIAATSAHGATPTPARVAGNAPALVARGAAPTQSHVAAYRISGTLR